MTDLQTINGKLYNVEQRVNGLVAATTDFNLVGESIPATPAAGSSVLFATTAGVPSVVRDDGNVYQFSKALTRVGNNVPTVSGTSFTGMLSLNVPAGEFRFRVHTTIKCANSNGGSPCVSMGHGTTASVGLCLAQAAWHAATGQTPGVSDAWTTHSGTGLPGDNVAGITMVNGGVYTWICDGWASFTAGGTLVVSGNNSISGGSYVQQSGSYFEVEPH